LDGEIRRIRGVTRQKCAATAKASLVIRTRGSGFSRLDDWGIPVDPGLPAFNEALVDAIRQWEFEPSRLDNSLVPVSMTFTANINWT
jgi:hypothetical protein